MADNVTLNAGSGGDSIATEDIAGVEYQKVKLVDGTAASTTAIPLSGDLTNGLDVDVTRVGGTVTVDLGANNDVTVTSGAINATLGAETTKVIGTVNIAAAQSVAVTNAGTFATQIDGSALTALQLIDNPIVAHDAAISGSTGVNVIGLNARSTEPTAVASADATRATATLLGKQVMLPYAIPASSWSYASTAAVTDTADDAAKAAAGAGIRNYITGIQVFNGHDTVATEVVIKDGSTVIWRGWAEQTGGGCSARFDPPLRGTANTAVNVANITTGSSTYFNLQGYVAAE